MYELEKLLPHILQENAFNVRGKAVSAELKNYYYHKFYKKCIQCMEEKTVSVAVKHLDLSEMLSTRYAHIFMSTHDI